MNRPTVLARWAISKPFVGKILYINDFFDPSDSIPFEGDVITRPFLLDPETRRPLPVRVVEVHNVGFPVLEYVIVEVAPAVLS